MPESVRALAEKTVNQSREAYERGKDALEEAIDALERSFDAAGQGATAFNRKLIDLAQRNLNSAFDLAKSLAGAKTLGEIVELQSDLHSPPVRRVRQPGGRDQGVEQQDRRRHRRADQESGDPLARRDSEIAVTRDSVAEFFEGRKRSAQSKAWGAKPRAFFYGGGRSGSPPSPGATPRPNRRPARLQPLLAPLRFAPKAPPTCRRSSAG